MSNLPTGASYGAVGIIIGAVLWALQTYAFHGAVPGALIPAIDLVVTTAYGIAVHYLTKRSTKPSVMASKRASAPRAS